MNKPQRHEGHDERGQQTPAGPDLHVGSGDYAMERHKWVDEMSLEDILKAAKARQKRTKSAKKRS